MSDPNPLDAATFGPVVQTLQTDRSAGWRLGRDTLLANYETFVGSMQPYQVIKLAVELDRHSLFCDVAADKSNREKDQQALAEFQKYLHGEVEVDHPAPLSPRTLSANGVTVTVDDPERFEDDDEEE